MQKKESKDCISFRHFGVKLKPNATECECKPDATRLIIREAHKQMISGFAKSKLEGGKTGRKKKKEYIIFQLYVEKNIYN